jgi:hypothetical protein
MATIAEIRAKYPQYNDISDDGLADALYAKHYSDMPRAEFNEKIGLVPGAIAASAASQTLQGGPGPPRESFGASYPGQAISGANEGIAELLGAPVDIASQLINLGVGGANAAFGTDIPTVKDPMLGSGTFKAMMGPAISPPSEDPGKQVVRRVGQEFGAAAIPALGVAGRAARPLRVLGGEAALTAGSGAGAAAAEQIAPDNPWAELLGQVGGALGVSGATRAAKRAITPFDTSPERAAAADLMRDEGVELTAGQQTGNKGLQYTESELGGGRVGDMTEQQSQQFTSAALRRAGITADRASPEVMDRAFSTIGSEFDDLARRSQMPLDRALGQELSDAITDYRDLVPEPMRAPVVENSIAALINAAKGGTLVPGAAYAALRSRIDRLARSSAKDPQLSDALYGIRNSMDNAVERYLAQADPQALDAWRQARGDYRNMLVLERAAQGGGENAALGLISPAQLRMAVTNIYGKRNHVRGRNELSPLAQAGQATMTPLPQSGTAPRVAVQAVKGALPFAGAALGGGGTLGLGALAGAAAGAAVPAIAGRAMLSGPGRRYLANRVIQDRRGAASGAGPAAGIATSQTGQNAPSSLITWLKRSGFDDLAKAVRSGDMKPEAAMELARKRRTKSITEITVPYGPASAAVPANS